MLSLILLITFNDRGNFNPSFFTKAYKNNLNSDKTQFKCMNSDKYINLNQINDGICDCCDGSDEFLNLTYCYNTCPLQLTKTDTKKLTNLYYSAIEKRKLLSKNRTDEFLAFKKELSEKHKELDLLKQYVDKLTLDYNNSKQILKAWTYKTLNLPPFDPVSEKKEKEEYINKINLKKYFKKHHKEDELEEEEEEGTKKTPQISQLELEQIKDKRRLKWAEKKHYEYEKRLQKALETYKESIKKMSIAENPTEYTNCKDLKKKLKNAKEKYELLKNEVENGDVRVTQNFGPDNIWFGLSEKQFEVEIPNENAFVSFKFMDSASLNPKDTNQAFLLKREIGPYRPPIDKMMYYGPKEITDNWNEYSFAVKLICYPDFRVFQTTAPVISRIQSIIGLPEACNATANENDLQTFLHEVAHYSHELKNEKEL